MSSSWSVEHLGLGNDPGHLKDDVKVVVPVVDLGDVIFLERVFNRQRMKMEVLAKPLLQVIAGVLVGPLDVDPEQAGLVLDRLIDLGDRPVGVKDARAVAIAEMNVRFTRREPRCGGTDEFSAAWAGGVIAILPIPALPRPLPADCAVLQSDRFVDDVDHERLGGLGGNGAANR